MADGTSYSSPSTLSASLTPAPSPAEPGETLPLGCWARTVWAGGGPWLRDVAARVVVVVVAVMMVHPLRALTTCPDMVLPLARLARLRLD